VELQNRADFPPLPPVSCELPLVEQAIETSALMLRRDKSHNPVPRRDGRRGQSCGTMSNLDLANNSLVEPR
jgi:hypothetical protein